MRVLGTALLLCVPLGAPAAAGDGDAPVQVRRPEALEVLKASPAGLESGGQAAFQARLKGGYHSPFVVLTDARGDVFFPEPERVVVTGDTFTATLDFPGDDGRFRVDVLASGPKGEEEVCSFHVAVGVQPAPASEQGPPGEVPTPAPGSGAPPPPANGGAPSAGERLLLDRRVASVACVEELSRVRAQRGLEPVFHDQRIFVVCMECAREMGNKGRFGAAELKMKPATRASVFHGWGIGMYDNYTGSYKSIFSPADVIARLGGSLAQGSMFSKGGVNVGGFGFWENSRNPAEVFIVMGLGKDSKLPRIRAAQAKVADARKELSEAQGAARVKVVRAVAALDSMEAAPFLAEVLVSDPEPDARLAAAAGLRELADSSVVDALIEGLATDEPKVQDAVGKALESITRRRFGVDQRKWRAWWEIERDFFRR